MRQAIESLLKDAQTRYDIALTGANPPEVDSRITRLEAELEEMKKRLNAKGVLS